MKLASIWTDHAIIQRDKQIVVWGWCEAKRTKINASLGPVSSYGATAWDGRFELRLPALPAGGPYELTVKTATGECAVVKDILVGEVWLVSGQSNAEFPLKTYNFNDPLAQTEQYLAEGGDTPMIRCFTVSKDSLCSFGDDLPPNSTWELSSPATAENFTAIGAWFALFFHKQFPDIPIGIIHSSWGGSYLFSWLSRAGLAKSESGRKYLAEDDAQIFVQQPWNEFPDEISKPVVPIFVTLTDFNEVTETDRGNSGLPLGYASPDFDDSSWENMLVPGSWIQQELGKNGAMWMRKTVDLAASWANQPLELHLGSVDKMDTSYFNGVEIGSTGSGFDVTCWNRERVYPIPSNLVKAGKNVIAVRGFSFYYDGSMSGNFQQYYLVNNTTGERIPLNGNDWKACQEYSIDIKVYNPPCNPINNFHVPHRLFDHLIHPLIPYAIRGVLWYQGESEHDFQERTDNFLEHFSTMIEEWRYLWGQGEDFPFYFVQLANWKTTFPERWLKIQDLQRRTYLQVPNTGIVTASDLALNEPLDIHPHDKRTFGYRLFLLALSNTYGCKDVIPQGPTLDKVSADGPTLRLHFLFAEGLRSKGSLPLRGFEIAGADGNFVKASAMISGDEVILTAETLKAPTQCRYNAQVNLPDGNLVNKAGLPALSFLSEIE